MKFSKMILFGLLIITLIVPFVSVAHAADIPDHVGVEEGQTYVWTTEFDTGPLEDYYEDIGKDKETAEKNAIDGFENVEWEEEVTEWKLTIYSISEEKDINYTDFYIPAEIRGDYTYSEIVYTLKEYDGDVGWWRKIDYYETAKILESEEILWAAYYMKWGEGPVFKLSRR